MASAGFDLTNQVANAFEDFTTTPGPLLLSAEAFPVGGYPPWWCTPSVFKTNSTCGTAVPPISLSRRGLYDATGNTFSNATLPTNYNLTINNAMQTILAAIRIDLGNIFPNNFLVHRTPDVIRGTISSTIPIQGFPTQTSMLYGLIGNGDGWLQNHGGLFTLNPDSVSPSQISLEYQCRVSQRKSARSLFIAITVATLTLFNTGWGIVTSLLIWLVLRHRPQEKKECVGNGTLEAKLRDQEAKIQDLQRRMGEKLLAGNDALEAKTLDSEHEASEKPLAGSDDQVQVPELQSSTASLPNLGRS
ncbi:hypothetical protein FRB94_011582 [Tulasnella sp. JGI-2019a]|nr:hypothetical protein FRB93_000658 [Tulasnella sp. JGI-2019a]KAG9009726.1 hypothetical protein FRB94_011582 [Tulasnella sp. JGI-2019a]